jgi:ribosomal protein S18 acetylase RimI-like enzyme
MAERNDDLDKLLKEVDEATGYKPKQRVAGYRPLNRTTGDKTKDSLLDQAGRQTDVDPNLLYAQGFQESRFKSNAVSPKGAVGDAQFMPDTAREYGLRVDGNVDERRDPSKAIPAQAKLMRKLLDRTGDIDLALAGYNSGHNASVDTLRRNSRSIAETRDYIKKIRANYEANPTPANYDALLSEVDSLLSNQPQSGVGAGDQSSTALLEEVDNLLALNRPPGETKQPTGPGPTVPGTQRVNPEVPPQSDFPAGYTRDTSTRPRIVGQEDDTPPRRILSPDEIPPPFIVSPNDPQAEMKNNYYEFLKASGQEDSQKARDEFNAIQQTTATAANVENKTAFDTANAAITAQNAQIKAANAKNKAAVDAKNAAITAQNETLRQQQPVNQLPPIAQQPDDAPVLPSRPTTTPIQVRKGENVRQAIENITRQRLAEAGFEAQDIEKVLARNPIKFEGGSVATDTDFQALAQSDQIIRHTVAPILFQQAEEERRNRLEQAQRVERAQDRTAKPTSANLEQMLEQGQITQEQYEKGRRANNEDLLDALLQEGAISPDRYSTLKFEEAKQQEREDRARAKWIQDNPIRGVRFDENFTDLGAANPEQAEKDRAERIKTILEDNGSFENYYETQRLLEEKYKFRPLARPLNFAQSAYKAPIKAAASILQSSAIAQELLSYPADLIARQFGAGPVGNATDNPLFQAGKWLEKATEEITLNKDYGKDFKDELHPVIGDTIGQVTTQMLLGLLTGGAALPTLVGGSMGAAGAYSDAIKFGAGKEVRLGAALLGGAASIPDYFIQAPWFNRMASNGKSRLISVFGDSLTARLGVELGDKAANKTAATFFNGLERNALRLAAAETAPGRITALREFAESVGQKALSIAESGVKEGFQEVSENKINDFYAYLTFDASEKRYNKLTSINNEDVAAFIGGLVGGSIGGTASYVLNRTDPNEVTGIFEELKNVAEDMRADGVISDEEFQTATKTADAYIDLTQNADGVYEFVPDQPPIDPNTEAQDPLDPATQQSAPTESQNEPLRRGNRIGGEDPLALAEKNPLRIENAIPEAVTRIQTDTRAQKVIEKLAGGQNLSVAALRKATRYSDANLNKVIDDLFAARAIEILPDNTIRLIGGAPSTPTSANLYDKYSNFTPETPQTPAQKAQEQINQRQQEAPKPAPVPESVKTIDSQHRAMKDDRSGRSAVLITEGEQLPEGVDPDTVQVTINTGETLLVNPYKAEVLFNLTSPEAITEFANDPENLQKLLGRVETVANTSKGFAVVSRDKDGNELNSSVVTSETAAEMQRELDKQNFPDTYFESEVMPVQNAIQERESNNPLVNAERIFKARQKAEADKKTAETTAKTGKVLKQPIKESRQIYTQNFKVGAENKVISADDMITSFDEGFPQELQPRDTNREASNAKIEEITRKLDPDRLGDEGFAGDGRPVVVPVEVNGQTKYAVIAGNHRGKGIKNRYEAGDNAKYQAFATEKGGKGVAKPVYVAQIDPTDIDLKQFAKEANEPQQRQMSPAEQAKVDAQQLTPGLLQKFVPAEDGSIHMSANREFIRDFMRNIVSQTEQGRLQTADGALSQEGVNRVRNAILFRLFGETAAGQELVEKIVESPDNNIKRVTNTFLLISRKLLALSEAVKFGSRYPGLDISADLAQAAAKFSSLRQEGSDVAAYLQQMSLFGDDLSPFQKFILHTIDRYAHSQKALFGIINNFVIASNALGDPNQPSLIPLDAPPSPAELFKAALDEYENGNFENLPNQGAFEFNQGIETESGERQTAQEGDSQGDTASAGSETAQTQQSADQRLSGQPEVKTTGFRTLAINDQFTYPNKPDTVFEVQNNGNGGQGKFRIKNLSTGLEFEQKFPERVIKTLTFVSPKTEAEPSALETAESQKAQAASAAEVAKYRQFGKYPKERIRTNNFGYEYVVGDATWNRKNPQRQEFLFDLGDPNAPERPSQPIEPEPKIEPAQAVPSRSLKVGDRFTPIDRPRHIFRVTEETPTGFKTANETNPKAFAADWPKNEVYVRRIIAKAPEVATAQTKEPFEMTQAEYKQTKKTDIDADAFIFGVALVLGESALANGKVKASSILPFYDVFEGKGGAKGAEHFAAVAFALKQSKAVPAAVLAEHQRLTKEIQQPTTNEAAAEKPKTENQFSFSSTQVNLPDNEAKEITRFARSFIAQADLAEDGFEENPHITVKYGLHTNDANDVKGIFADQGPITATLGTTKVFYGKENDKPYDVVIVEVTSPDLHKLNKHIAKNTDVTDTFPDYKPHLTLAYVKAGLGDKYANNTEFEGRSITFDSVEFSPKEGQSVEFALGSKETPPAIRQLGSGANVYFETDKHRVNDGKDGKVLLIVGSKTSAMPLGDFEFDNAADAVAIAKQIDKTYPNGAPEALLLDKYIERLKASLSAPAKTNKLTEAVDAMRQKVREQDDKIRKFVEANNDTPFQASFGAGQSVILHKSVKPASKDKWQASFFDDTGLPFSDTVFDTYEQAVDEIARSYNVDLAAVKFNKRIEKPAQPAPRTELKPGDRFAYPARPNKVFEVQASTPETPKNSVRLKNLDNGKVYDQPMPKSTIPQLIAIAPGEIVAAPAETVQESAPSWSPLPQQRGFRMVTDHGRYEVTTDGGKTVLTTFVKEGKEVGEGSTQTFSSMEAAKEFVALVEAARAKILQKAEEGKSFVDEEEDYAFSIPELDTTGITLNKNKDGKTLAPNGNVSNIQNEGLAKKIRTPEFIEWFGDWVNAPQNASKVVDENGEPLVVYHGTAAPITKFDQSKTQDTLFWFTSNLADITEGRSGAKSTKHVESLFLNLRNPAKWPEEDKLMTQQMIDQGFDGKILDDYFVAFYPKQIKSVSNKGTFSKDNDSIMFARPAKTENAALQQISDAPLLVVHNLSADNLEHTIAVGGLAAPSLAIINPKNPFTSFGNISLIADKSLINPKATALNKVFNADSYSVRYPRVIYFFNYSQGEKLKEKVARIIDPKRVDRYSATDDIESKGKRALRDNPLIQAAFAIKNGLQKPVLEKAPKADSLVRYILKNNLTNKREYQLKDDPAFRKRYIEHANQYIAQMAAVDQEFAERVAKKESTYEEIARAQYFSADGSVQIGKHDEVVRKALNTAKTIANKPIDIRATADKFTQRITPEQRAEYQKFVNELYEPLDVQERIFRGFTNSGNRKYIPHTLQNVVSIMKGGARGGEDFFYGGGSVRAGIAKQFKSIADIQTDREKVISKDDFERIKEEINSELNEITNELAPYYKYRSNSIGYTDEAAKALIEFYKRGRSQNFEDVPDELVKQINSFLIKLKNAPTEYFEAKLERSVRLSEFKGAVVPKSLSAYHKQLLRDAGLKVVEYKDKQSFDKFEELMFSRPSRATNEEFDDAALRLATLNLEDGQVIYPNLKTVPQELLWSKRNYDLYIARHKDIPEAGPFELSIDQDNEVVGFVRATIANNTISINLIHIKEEFRGAGIGTDIYETLLEKGYVIKSDSEITDSTYSIYDTLAKQNEYEAIVFPDGRIGLKLSAKTTSDSIMFSRPLTEPAPTFYSAVERAIETSPQTKFTVDQVNALLKKPGIKKEEVDWMGLPAFLEGKDKTTKQELLDFVAENKVELVEVVKGIERKQKVAEAKQLLEKYDTDYILDLDAVSESDDNLQLESSINFGIGALIDKIEDTDLDRLQSLAGYFRRLDRVGDAATKYSQFVTPGGSNYKEVLLTLPAVTTSKPYKQWLHENFTGIDTEDARRVYKEQQDPAQNFTSSHWDESNVVLHTRWDERTDAAGRRTLHVAEIQSDWHQKGRKSGYKVDPKEIQKASQAVDAAKVILDAAVSDARANKKHRIETLFLDGQQISSGTAWPEILTNVDQNVWNAANLSLADQADFRSLRNNFDENAVAGRFELRRSYELSPEEQRINKALEEANRTYQTAKDELRQFKTGEVPDAPLKKSWPLVGFKKALRYAAENGFDAVSIDTGQTNADRYDLSKQVDSIDVITHVEGGRLIDIRKDGDSVLAFRYNDNGTITDGEYEGTTIDEVIGKDLADKILNLPEPPEQKSFSKLIHRYEGDGLKIGGRGMLKFYDDILVNEVNKYVKQWGSKVEPGALQNEQENNEITAVRYATAIDHMTQDISTIPGYDYIEANDWLIEHKTAGFIWFEKGNLTKEQAIASFRQTAAEADSPVYQDFAKDTAAHTVPITDAMRESVMQGQPLFAKEITDAPTQFANNEAVKGLVKKLRVLHKSPTETLITEATAEYTPKETSHINPAAAELIRRAFAGSNDDVFYGAYLTPPQVRQMRERMRGLVNPLLSREERLQQTQALDNLFFSIAKPSEFTGTGFSDAVIVVTDENLPNGYNKAIEEEIAHRATIRTGTGEFMDFQAIDGYGQAIVNTAKVYDNLGPTGLHKEVIAKVFRSDAEKELGITAEQIDAIADRYQELLEERDIEIEAIEINFAPIGTPRAQRFIDEAATRRRKGTIGNDGRGGPRQSNSYDEDQKELRGRSDEYRPQLAPKESRPLERRGRVLAEAERGMDWQFAELNNKSLATQKKLDILFARPTPEEYENFEKNADSHFKTIASYIYDGKRDLPLPEALMNIMRTGYLAGFSVIKTNLIGNSTSILVEQAAKPFMAAADMLNPNTKERTVPGLSPRDVFYGLFGKTGMFRGGIVGEKGFLTAMKEGVGVRELNRVDMNLTDSTSPFVRNTGVPLIDVIIEGTKRLVVGIDRPFKAYARSAEKSGLARLEAAKEMGISPTFASGKEFRRRMKELRDDPTTMIADLAERYAEVVTFQNPNAITEMYGKFRRFLIDEKTQQEIIKNPVHRTMLKYIGGTAYVASGFYAPFISTPTNVGLRTLEYLFPTGIVAAAFKFQRIGQTLERAEFIHDEAERREKIIRRLSAVRASQDRIFRKETDVRRREYTDQKTAKLNDFEELRIKARASDTLTDAQRKARIKEINAKQKEWLSKWSNARSGYLDKRRALENQAYRERRLSDKILLEQWQQGDEYADLKFSQFENRAFAETVGRAGFGATVGGLLLLAVLAGILEAVGDTGFDEEKDKYFQKRAAGIANNSVQIGATRVNYADSPFGKALSMGLTLFEQYERPGDGSERAKAMGKMFGKQVLAMNPLTTQEFKMTDPASWAGSKANAITPLVNLRILQEIAEVADDKPRKYWSEGFTAQYLIKLPKLRESLPESNNYLGGSEERGDMYRRFIRLLDPLKSTTPTTSQRLLKSTPLPKPKPPPMSPEVKRQKLDEILKGN